MQIAVPFVSAPRPKQKFYRRAHLRAAHELREKLHQERLKLAKLRAKKYDWEWRNRHEDRGVDTS